MTMSVMRIQALISFHQAGLQEHRFAMSPAAVQLEEETIKALKLLKTWSYILDGSSSIITGGDSGVATDRR